MAQQTSALTHLRLEPGSIAVTHSDTSKQSLSHSISITYLPWLTWGSTARTWPWGLPPGHGLPWFSDIYGFRQNGRIAFCSIVSFLWDCHLHMKSLHKALKLEVGWYKRIKYTATSIVQWRGNMLESSKRIYMCELLKVLVCFERIRLYVMPSDHQRLFYIQYLFWMFTLKGEGQKNYPSYRAEGRNDCTSLYILKGNVLFKLNSCQLGSTLIGAPGWCSQKGTPHPGLVSMLLTVPHQTKMACS